MDVLVVPLVVDADGVTAGVGGAAALGVDAAAFVSRFRIDFPGVTGVVDAMAELGTLFDACLLACCADAGALSRRGVLAAMRTLAELSDCQPLEVVSRSETASAGTSHPDASLTVAVLAAFAAVLALVALVVALLAVGMVG